MPAVPSTAAAPAIQCTLPTCQHLAFTRVQNEIIRKKDVMWNERAKMVRENDATNISVIRARDTVIASQAKIIANNTALWKGRPAYENKMRRQWSSAMADHEDERREWGVSMREADAKHTQIMRAKDADRKQDLRRDEVMHAAEIRDMKADFARVLEEKDLDLKLALEEKDLDLKLALEEKTTQLTEATDALKEMTSQKDALHESCRRLRSGIRSACTDLNGARTDSEKHLNDTIQAQETTIQKLLASQTASMRSKDELLSKKDELLRKTDELLHQCRERLASAKKDNILGQSPTQPPVLIADPPAPVKKPSVNNTRAQPVPTPKIETPLPKQRVNDTSEPKSSDTSSKPAPAKPSSQRRMSAGWVSANIILTPSQRKHLSIKSVFYIICLMNRIPGDTRTTRVVMGTTSDSLLDRLNEFADANDVVSLVQAWHITDVMGLENPTILHEMVEGIESLRLNMDQTSYPTTVINSDTYTTYATMYMNQNKDLFRRQKVKSSFIDKLNEQYITINMERTRLFAKVNTDQ